MKPLQILLIFLMQQNICFAQIIIGQVPKNSILKNFNFQLWTNENLNKIIDKDSIDITNDNIADIAFQILQSNGGSGVEKCAELSYSIINQDILLLYNDSNEIAIFKNGDIIDPNSAIANWNKSLNDVIGRNACKGLYMPFMNVLQNRFFLFKNNKTETYGTIQFSTDISLVIFQTKSLTFDIHAVVMDTSTKQATNPSPQPSAYIFPNPVLNDILGLANFNTIQNVQLIDIAGRKIPLTLLNKAQLLMPTINGIYFWLY
jgi:hypothetical protein